MPCHRLNRFKCNNHLSISLIWAWTMNNSILGDHATYLIFTAKEIVNKWKSAIIFPSYHNRGVTGKLSIYLLCAYYSFLVPPFILGCHSPSEAYIYISSFKEYWVISDINNIYSLIVFLSASLLVENMPTFNLQACLSFA